MAIFKTRIIARLVGLDFYNAPDLSAFDHEELRTYTSSFSFIDSLTPLLTELESIYHTVSAESYTCVVLQAIKLLYFGRFHIEEYVATPGLSDSLKTLKGVVSDQIYAELARPPRSLSGSNVFTLAESALLLWASIHYSAQNPKSPRVFSSFSDLRDGAIFMYIIKNHIPDVPLAIVTDRQVNYEHLTSTLRSLKLHFFPTVSELAEGNVIILAILLYELYKILPHYLAALSLDFDTPLNKPLVQSVTFTNPSRDYVTYSTQLVGSKSFQCLANKMTLSPNQTAEVQIRFGANTHTPQTATLRLIPERAARSLPTAREMEQTGLLTATMSMKKLPPLPDDFTSDGPRNFASPIVVRLTSAVRCDSALKSFRVEGPIYEPTPTVIDIDYPYDTPGCFNLFSRYYQLPDDTASPAAQKSLLKQQIRDLLDNPSMRLEPNGETAFERAVEQHQPFLFDRRVVDFASTRQMGVEFNPLGLGTYRCLLLFQHDQLGEFICEIVARALPPSPIELTTPVIKAEARKKASVRIPIDVFNPAIPKTLAYSREKLATAEGNMSERAFKEHLLYRTRELTNILMQNFTHVKFQATVSGGYYFQCPAEVFVSKGVVEGMPRENANVIPLTFSPMRPGKYPNKICLVSPIDVRVYSVVGNGLAVTREMEIILEAVAGVTIQQDIPFENTSKDPWVFKTSLTGPSGFVAPQRFTVPPKGVGTLPLSFSTRVMGTYHAELTVTNLTKECVTVFRVTAQVAEPPAQEKIDVTCRAREAFIRRVNIPPFLQDGPVKVTSNVEIIDFPAVIQFEHGRPRTPFEFSVLALRSGFSAGQLTFTDVATKFFCWFVLEFHVDPPLPEATIDVETEARKTVTIEIPLTNATDREIVFDVVLASDEFFGPATLKIAPRGSTTYRVMFSPLKEEKRYSTVSFYNDMDGEYLYLLNLNVHAPGIDTLAPMSCPIGRSDKTTLMLENPLSATATFRVENTNPAAFQVMCKPTFEIRGNQRKTLEILYMPSFVGQREEATIQFNSPELGQYMYGLIGTGKPPQVFSPIVIEAMVGSTASGSVDFVNPFPYKMTYAFAITVQTPGTFALLNKKRTFTLNSYSELRQIPFTFKPPTTGQFCADVVVVGRDEIQWFYPIRGTGIASRGVVVQSLTGRSGDEITRSISFPLIGERDDFEPSECNLKVIYPRGYEFLTEYLTARPSGSESVDGAPALVGAIRFCPRRPFDLVVEVEIENAVSQTWHFQMKLAITSAPPLETITLECGLGKVVTYQVKIAEIFSNRTLCHAYFASGSASEFTVSESESWIEVSLADMCELPFQVIYTPTTYGKVQKGLLVVDTRESQWIFEFMGRTPEYVPPTILKSGRIDVSMPESAKKSAEDRAGRKRNVIKEGIEFAKMVRPKTSLQTRPPGLLRPAKKANLNVTS
jgi:hypothetical protein